MMEPVPAATVIVCRITKKWPHKILLQKRSERAKFLPGAHVFPGGSLEDRDSAFAQILSRDAEHLAHRAAIFGADASTTARFLAGAIRETFEETGFSIVREQGSAKIIAATTLASIINNPEATSLAPSLASLWPISWWITPHGETRRFDTRFFLALVDDAPFLDNFAVKNAEGISDYRWLNPDEALAAYAGKNIFLAPPTRSILERMAATTSLDDFLNFVDRPLKPIRPFFIDDAQGNKVLVLPGDPAHDERVRPLMLMHTRYAFP